MTQGYFLPNIKGQEKADEVFESLKTYLHFIANWLIGTTDQQIQSVIDEQKLLLTLGNFNANSAVDSASNDIISKIKELKTDIIAYDSAEAAADAAKAAEFTSFGTSMIAYEGFKQTARALESSISKKQSSINNSVQNLDTDIASKVNHNVSVYIKAFEANNATITAHNPKGLDITQCRTNLMQFLLQCDLYFKDKGALTVQNFKKLANSAAVAYNNDQLNKVKDALSLFETEGTQSTADVNKLIDRINKCGVGDQSSTDLIQNFSLSQVATPENYPAIEKALAGKIQIPGVHGVLAFGLQISLNLTGMMPLFGDLTSIYKDVKKCDKVIDEINNTMKPHYKQFYEGLNQAAKAYQSVLGES